MKSRHLNVIEFLEQLQIEYLQAEFKRAIHHSVKQKKFYKRVMDGKRTKIEDLSTKSNLQNIFNSFETLQEFRKLVYPNPNAIGISFKLTPEEFELYFSVGSPVKVEVEKGRFLTGKIEEVFFDKSLASVRLRGSKQPSKHLFSKIIRVF